MSLCKPCERIDVISNAVYRCKTCVELCCEGCRKDHRKFLVLRNHQFEKIETIGDVVLKQKDQKQVSVKQILRDYENVATGGDEHTYKQVPIARDKLGLTDQKVAVSETYSNIKQKNQNQEGLLKDYENVAPATVEHTYKQGPMTQDKLNLTNPEVAVGDIYSNVPRDLSYPQTATIGTANNQNASDTEMQLRRKDDEYVNIRPQSVQCVIENVAKNESGIIPGDFVATFQDVRVLQSELSEKIGISDLVGNLTAYPNRITFIQGDIFVDLPFAFIRRFGVKEKDRGILRVEIGRKFYHGEGILYFGTNEASEIRRLMIKQISLRMDKR